jgi:hypothetical protein
MVLTSFSSQMSLCPSFLFFCNQSAGMANTSNHFHILNCAGSKEFFHNILGSHSCAVECVTGWLVLSVWTQHSGLIFKGHMSNADGPLKVRLLHCLNGKTCWYSSIPIIHDFCDSFPESVKLIYMLVLHFIVLFVQLLWAFYANSALQYFHSYMVTCGCMGDL